MKTLREMILEKLMNHNNDSIVSEKLVTEKLKISKNTKGFVKNGKFKDDIEVKGDTIIVTLPDLTIDKNDYLVEYTGPERTIELPNNKFYVFKDPYRNNLLHINYFEDFIGNIACLFRYYEDFKPENIVFSSNSLEECIEFILDEKGIDKDDFIDDDSNINHIKGVYDNIEILRDVLRGDIDESEFEFSLVNSSIEDSIKEFN